MTNLLDKINTLTQTKIDPIKVTQTQYNNIEALVVCYMAAVEQGADSPQSKVLMKRLDEIFDSIFKVKMG
jgi:hypothetical protein